MLSNLPLPPIGPASIVITSGPLPLISYEFQKPLSPYFGPAPFQRETGTVMFRRNPPRLCFATPSAPPNGPPPSGFLPPPFKPPFLPKAFLVGEGLPFSALTVNLPLLPQPPKELSHHPIGSDFFDIFFSWSISPFLPPIYPCPSSSLTSSFCQAPYHLSTDVLLPQLVFRAPFNPYTWILPTGFSLFFFVLPFFLQ